MNIVVTGAARGVGLSLVLEICKIERKKNTKVNFGLIEKDNFSSLEKLSIELNSLGFQTYAKIVDVRDEVAIRSYILKYEDKFGDIDVLIANAGESPMSGTDFSIKDARALMEINYFGVLNTIQPLLDNRRYTTDQKLRVVTISSIGSLVSTQNSHSYSASKAALSMLIESFALKFRNTRVSLLNVILGFVDTRSIEGLPHAKFLQISPEVAARKIYNAINSRKSITSIPRFRNLIFYELQFLPSKLRHALLHQAYVHLSRKNSKDKNSSGAYNSNKRVI